MTDPRQQRITDLHDAMAIQIAILAELAKSFDLEGLDEDARATREIVDILENGPKTEHGESDTTDPVHRVRLAVPMLKALEGRISKSRRWRAVGLAVEGVRRVLVRYADFTLTDTQPIDLDALGFKDKR